MSSNGDDTPKFLVATMLGALLISGLMITLSLLLSCQHKPTCDEECRRLNKNRDEITRTICDDPSNKKIYLECNQFDGAHP